jgi:hypothetical protein
MVGAAEGAGPIIRYASIERQMRAREHSVEKFARDERSLDGLAHADVVGDEQPNRIELERHEKGNELISSWLDRDLSKGSKRTGAPSE